MEKKEIVIAEYLSGGISYRKLGKKHGIDFRTINSWIMKYKGKERNRNSKIVVKNSTLETVPTDVVKLQKELSTALLHAKLLNAMIDIAEKELKIDIRKKSGTKR
jgi:transposase-like protein